MRSISTRTIVVPEATGDSLLDFVKPARPVNLGTDILSWPEALAVFQPYVYQRDAIACLQPCNAIHQCEPKTYMQLLTEWLVTWPEVVLLAAWCLWRSAFELGRLCRQLLSLLPGVGDNGNHSRKRRRPTHGDPFPSTLDVMYDNLRWARSHWIWITILCGGWTGICGYGMGRASMLERVDLLEEEEVEEWWVTFYITYFSLAAWALLNMMFWTFCSGATSPHRSSFGIPWAVGLCRSLRRFLPPSSPSSHGATSTPLQRRQTAPEQVTARDEGPSRRTSAPRSRMPRQHRHGVPTYTQPRPQEPQPQAPRADTRSRGAAPSPEPNHGQQGGNRRSTRLQAKVKSR